MFADLPVDVKRQIVLLKEEQIEYAENRNLLLSMYEKIKKNHNDTDSIIIQKILKKSYQNIYNSYKQMASGTVTVEEMIEELYNIYSAK